MKLRFVSRARQHLAEAAAWYAARAPALDQRFALAVAGALATLRDHPLHGRPVTPDVRRVLVATFPYSIYYLVEPDRVVVIAVLHTSRHPDTWRGRG